MRSGSSSAVAVRPRAPTAGRNRLAAPPAAAYSASIDDANPRNRPNQESTMTRNLYAQAVSFSLALVLTVSTLMGLNTLASGEHAAQQQVAATKVGQA
jgi:hypothetical protein